MNRTHTTLAAVAIATAATLGTALGAAPAGAASTEPAHFLGNGVRLHASASGSSTVKALGYKADHVGVYCVGGIQNIHVNGYVHLYDFTRDVAGWASDDLVDWACD